MSSLSSHIVPSLLFRGPRWGKVQEFISVAHFAKFKKYILYSEVVKIGSTTILHLCKL